MTPLTFKALIVEKQPDGTFSRRIGTRNLADLPPGEVLVRVHYSSLNYKDALSAAGNRGVTRHYPHTPGIDAAGVVEESTVADWQPGMEVLVCCYDLGMNTPGGFGQYIRVPGSWVMARPQGLSLRQCMIYGTAGFTAAQCVRRLLEHPVRPDDGPVLVTGATGGVGSVAVALLARQGFTVYAVTGKQEEEQFLLTLGAEKVLGRQEISDRPGRMLLKNRWPGVVDTVGGSPLVAAIKATRYGGCVTCCGNAAGADLPLNVYPFILRGVTLAGIDSAECPMARRQAIWQQLAAADLATVLELLVTEIDLAAVDAAITTMLAGRHRGRTVINLA